MYVIDDQIIDERWGHEPHTTNNRMELMSLIAVSALVPPGTAATLYSDSQLCVSTINTGPRVGRREVGSAKAGRSKTSISSKSSMPFSRSPRTRAPLDCRPFGQPMERIRRRARHGLPSQQALTRSLNLREASA